MEFARQLATLRKTLGLTQEEMGTRLGVSGNWISLLEGNKKEPGDALMRHLELLQQAVDAGLLEKAQPIKMQPVDCKIPDPEFPPAKFVPVIGWAHAGESAGYEEIPKSWADQVPTECRDPKAFAVRLEGDSMEPTFREGDLLIVMPSKEPYSGCFVVCRFKDDGVVFRRLETAGSVIRLVPLNDRYPVSEHSAEDFSWIYPVWGRWSQLWKR